MSGTLTGSQVGPQAATKAEYDRPLAANYQIGESEGPAWISLTNTPGSYSDLDWIAPRGDAPVSMTKRVRSKGVISGPFTGKGDLKWPSPNDLGLVPGQYQFQIWRHGDSKPLASSATVTITPPPGAHPYNRPGRYFRADPAGPAVSAVEEAGIQRLIAQSQSRREKGMTRSYGGYYWTSEDGVMHEEGPTVEGSALLWANDLLIDCDARTGGIGDLYVIKEGMRGMVGQRGRRMGLGLYTNAGGDPLVDRWPETAVDYGMNTFRVAKRAPDKPVSVEIRTLIPGDWTIVHAITVSNHGPEVLQGSLLYGWWLGRGAKVSGRYDPSNQIVTAGLDAGIGHWEYALASNRPVVAHLVGTAAEPWGTLLVPLPGNDRNVQSAEGRDGVKAIVQVAVDVMPGKAQTVFFTVGLDQVSAGAVARAQRGLGVEPEKTAAEMKAFWREKTKNIRTGEARTNAWVKYGLIGVSANQERGGKTTGALHSWGPTGLQYPDGPTVTDAAFHMLDIPVGSGWAAEEFKKTFQFCELKSLDRLDQLRASWKAFAPPAQQEAYRKFASAVQGKIVMPDVRDVEVFEGLVSSPLPAERLYLATLDRPWLEHYYEVLGNSLQFVADHFTTKEGVVTISNPYSDDFNRSWGLRFGSGDVVNAATVSKTYGALGAMANLAEVLGKSNDVKKWLSWREVHRRELERHWNGTYFMINLDRDNYDNYATGWTAIVNVADEGRIKSALDNLLYAGSGFPSPHPPVVARPADPGYPPATPYTYQNGGMYLDQLGQLATAAALVGHEPVMSQVWDSWYKVMSRHKSFPVSISAWDGSLQYFSAPPGYETHACTSVLRCVFNGEGGLRYARNNIAFRPLMTEYSGARIEADGFLWANTSFDIAITGKGAGCSKLRVDGQEVPSEIVPATYHDGGRHRIEVLAGGPSSPQLRDLGNGVYQLDEVKISGAGLEVRFSGFVGERTRVKINTAGRHLRGGTLNGRNLRFQSAGSFAFADAVLDREANRLAIRW